MSVTLYLVARYGKCSGFHSQSISTLSNVVKSCLSRLLSDESKQSTRVGTLRPKCNLIIHQLSSADVPLSVNSHKNICVRIKINQESSHSCNTLISQVAGQTGNSDHRREVQVKISLKHWNSVFQSRKQCGNHDVLPLLATHTHTHTHRLLHLSCFIFGPARGSLDGIW